MHYLNLMFHGAEAIRSGFNAVWHPTLAKNARMGQPSLVMRMGKIKVCEAWATRR
jgi:hypothetical protein